MTQHTKRAATGAWALALSVAAGSLALADEKEQGTPTADVGKPALAGSGAKTDGAATPADVPKLTAGAEGFVLQSSSGDYRLQLRGYVQFDGRFFPSDVGVLAVDSFLLRRVRPIFTGSVGRHFEFQIYPDFGIGMAVLQDAWLDMKYSPKARLRVGKFKSPVGLERLQSATALAFVEQVFGGP